MAHRRVKPVRALAHLSAALLAAGAVATAEAAPASATPVTTCTEAALKAAIAEGGFVWIRCSGTITLSSEIDITSGQSVFVTGLFHSVTLSGNNLTRIFHVEGGHLTLSHVTLTKGLALGAVGPDGGDGSDGIDGDGGNGGNGGAPNGQAGTDGTDGGDAMPGDPGTDGGAATGGAILIDPGSVVVIRHVTISSSQAIGGAGGTGGDGGNGGSGGGGGSGGAGGGTAGGASSVSGVRAGRSLTRLAKAGGSARRFSVGLGVPFLQATFGLRAALKAAPADGTPGTDGNTGTGCDPEDYVGGGGGGQVGDVLIPTASYGGEGASAGYAIESDYAGTPGSGGNGGNGGNGGAGGDGGDGGNGGDAHGGAIMNEGTLTLVSDQFTSDSATGGAAGDAGDGGSAGWSGGGGQGGLGGICSDLSGNPVGAPGGAGGHAGNAAAGGDGGDGGKGGNASGGAIDNAGQLIMTGTKFTGDHVLAAAGGDGGLAAPVISAQVGGYGDVGTATSGTAGAAGAPGAPGAGGDGGNGGDAVGGALDDGGTLGIGSTSFATDSATAGAGGDPGYGVGSYDGFDGAEPGGCTLDFPTGYVCGDGSDGGAGPTGSDGGDGGAGGKAQGACFHSFGSPTLVTVSFSHCAATGGKGTNAEIGAPGGDGGDGGSPVGGTAPAGPGGNGGNGGDGGNGGTGGNGGDATGGAVWVGGTAQLGTTPTFLSDKVTAGKAGTGADGGAAGQAGEAGAPGGNPGNAGNGGATGSDGTAGTASLQDFAGSSAAEITPVITTTTVPAGTVGTSYSTSLSASGGYPPYTWSKSGTLPPGLFLLPSGEITGTPRTAGTYSFTVEVADVLGLTTSETLSITIS